jgi:hypothetical protein
MPPAHYRRGAQLVQAFSPEEDAYLTTLRIAGHGTTAIARAVSARFGKPRSPATINMRLKTLAKIEEGD